MSDVHVRAELVHRPADGGSTIDAIQLVASNDGDDTIVLRGAALLLPAGLRFFLPAHLAYPHVLSPGGQAAEWVECAVVAQELATLDLTGSVSVQGLFIAAPHHFEGVYERLLSAASSVQGWGPVCYSHPFLFPADRWKPAD